MNHEVSGEPRVQCIHKYIHLMVRVMQHMKIFFLLENNIPLKCCVDFTGGHMCLGSHTRPVLSVLSFVQNFEMEERSWCFDACQPSS